jgi:hypothetical protein
MGARRKDADFFFCSRNSSFGPAARRQNRTKGRGDGSERPGNRIAGKWKGGRRGEGSGRTNAEGEGGGGGRA